MWKKIYNNAFAHELNLKINFKDLKKRINNLNTDINYLYINNNIVGFAMVFPLYKNIWHIDYIAIDPKFQSLGYGKTLMNQIIKKYKYLSLECENNLVSYYKKFNFIKYNINYNYNGIFLNILLNKQIHNNKLKLLVCKLNNYNLLCLLVLINYLNIVFYLLSKRLIDSYNTLINYYYYKHENF